MIRSILHFLLFPFIIILLFIMYFLMILFNIEYKEDIYNIIRAYTYDLFYKE